MAAGEQKRRARRLEAGRSEREAQVPRPERVRARLREPEALFALLDDVDLELVGLDLELVGVDQALVGLDVELVDVDLELVDLDLELDNVDQELVDLDQELDDVDQELIGLDLELDDVDLELENDLGEFYHAQGEMPERRSKLALPLRE